MAMPFPGMDPCLEHPALWPSVHARFMVWLAHQLGPRIRPRYIATVEERVFIEGTQQQRIPDVWIQQVRDGGGRIAMAEPAASTPLILEVQELEVQELEVREHYIEILDRYRDEKVVTVIELASPANKTPGPGREAYLAKQRETLASQSHLVEVDLLRHGRHLLSVPEASARSVTDYDYLVCVNRWLWRKRFELYPCRLRERLPVIRVPLADPDPDVPLDLQAAFEQVYEDGSYMLRVRYDEPCDPPLPPEDQEWASQCWAAYRLEHRDWFPAEDA